MPASPHPRPVTPPDPPGHPGGPIGLRRPRRPHRPRRRVTDRRSGLVCGSRRPQRRRQVDTAAPAGRPRTAGLRLRHPRPAHRHRRLPGPGARAGAGRDGAVQPDPPHRGPGGRGRAGRRPRPDWPTAPARPRPATRLPSSGSPRSGRATSTPASTRCSTNSASGAALAERDDVHPLGGAGGQGGPGRRRAVPLLGHAARRAHQRPRLRGARAPPGVDRPAPGGMVIVSHDRAFLEQTVSTVLELDEHDHTAREFGGGWAGYQAERATARRHAEEAYELYERNRTGLRERADRQRQWATKGVARETRSPRDNDKAQRGFRIDRTEKLASKARRTDRALAALDEVEKPWEGWDLHFTIEQTGRAGDIVVRLARRGGRAGPFRLGPLDLEIAWGDRLGLTGPNGSGQVVAGGRRARDPAPGVGRAVGRAERGDRGAGPGPAGPGRRARPGPRRVRPVRPRRVRGPLPAGQIRARGRAGHPAGWHAVAGRADPGRAGRLPGARCQLPGPRRADQPSRPSGHRTARVGAALVHRDPAAGHPRPAHARVGGADPDAALG